MRLDRENRRQDTGFNNLGVRGGCRASSSRRSVWDRASCVGEAFAGGGVHQALVKSRSPWSPQFPVDAGDR